MVECVAPVMNDLVKLLQREKLLVSDGRQDEGEYIVYRAFHGRLVLGRTHTRRQDRRAVMFGHLLIAFVQNQLIAGMLDDTDFQIVRHQHPSHATKMIACIDMGGN